MDSSQLNAYRKLALRRFGTLLLKLFEQPNEVDNFVDRSIRQLSDLPARLFGEPPYVAIVPIVKDKLTLKQYRSRAIEQLADLLLRQLELTDIDNGMDQYIRLLSDLPVRAAQTDPYVELFILQEDAPHSPELPLPTGEGEASKAE